MLRPMILSAGLALPLPATAQVLDSWFDLLSPDLLIESVAQSAIIALRTQVDMIYGDLTVNGLAGRVDMTDLEFWPELPWDRDAGCHVTLDRLVLQTAPPGRIERLRLQATAYGVAAPAACLPPDVAPVLAMANLTEITVPQAGLDMSYHVPSSGAEIRLTTTVDRALAVDLDVVFDYIAFDGREDMEEPEPFGFLTSATLSLQNLGAWEVGRTMVPAAFATPEQVPNALGGLLGAGLAGMNRDAASSDAQGDPSALSPQQQQFVESAVAAWSQFLARPERLVLETQIDPEDPIFLDVEAYEDDPKRAFADLRPQVVTAPAQARAALPVALIQAALAPESTLSPEDRRRVGVALATGTGAPRHVGRGIDLLVPLARDGDGAAAEALSAALEHRQPENAYGWGLRAGASGAKGAAARLDRLERSLPFARVLEIQAEVSRGDSHPVEALNSLVSLKTEARKRLTGQGAPRSYEIAALWAMLAQAAGDGEAMAILADIDDRVLAAGPEAVAAWAPVEAAASNLALDTWLGRDLARQYGGN